MAQLDLRCTLIPTGGWYADLGAPELVGEVLLWPCLRSGGGDLRGLEVPCPGRRRGLDSKWNCVYASFRATVIIHDVCRKLSDAALQSPAGAWFFCPASSRAARSGSPSTRASRRSRAPRTRRTAGRCRTSRTPGAPRAGGTTASCTCAARTPASGGAAEHGSPLHSDVIEGGRKGVLALAGQALIQVPWIARCRLIFVT